jgi:hypothetical protein
MYLITVIHLEKYFVTNFATMNSKIFNLKINLKILNLSLSNV